MTDRHRLVIDDPRQIEVLAHPACAEIVSQLAGQGPLEVAEISQRTSRSPHALYRYIRMLEKSGLIVATKGERTHTGRPAKRYSLVAEELVAGESALAKIEAKQYLATARSVFSSTLRSFRQAARNDRLRTSGENRNITARKLILNLSPDQLIALNRLIAQFVERCGELSDSSREDGESVSVTLTVVPDD